MDHEVPPAEDIFNRLGDISEMEAFHNNVIVAVYQRPEKTKSGIYLTDRNRDEDKYQSKCGLVIKMGPRSFNDDSGAWQWPSVSIGDWVYFRPSDGWDMSIRGKDRKDPVLCRRLKDTSIEGKVSDPDTIW
jgi:co-chaperonin GroES (HSP10)